MQIIVEENRCPQNHICPAIKYCPVGALTQAGHTAPILDEEKCIKCAKCVMVCPMKALREV